MTSSQASAQETLLPESPAGGEHVLDARGLICPLPVLKARKILLRLKAGECLRVLATDPHAPADFQLFCRETGHVLKSVTSFPEGASILLQSKSAA